MIKDFFDNLALQKMFHRFFVPRGHEELEKVSSCSDSILIDLFRTPSFLYNYKEEEAFL